jgi:hypothetical protein
MAFNTKNIWKRRYELIKQLQNLYIIMALLSETYLKPHERFFIPNYRFLSGWPLPGKKMHFPLPCKPVLYVPYVHLTKAKHIHKRQTHFLVREDATQGLRLQGFS